MPNISKLWRRRGRVELPRLLFAVPALFERAPVANRCAPPYLEHRVDVESTKGGVAKDTQPGTIKLGRQPEN